MGEEKKDARWSFQKGDFVVEHIPQCNLCVNKYKGCCLLMSCKPPEEYWTNKKMPWLHRERVKPQAKEKFYERIYGRV